MNTISSNLLSDTLNLIQLARETALDKGNQSQAERLSPVVTNLRNLVKTTQEPRLSTTSTSLMAQDDFRTLISAAQQKPSQSGQISQSSPTERNQIINAMAAGGMGDIDIARQMGMTRDEIRLVLNLNQVSKSTMEVYR
jgi:DNA-binding NarL/FixJ family response regulator